MTQPAPIKEPVVEPDRYVSRTWLRWFQDLFQNEMVVVRNPSSPYTVVNDNELIFIETSTAFTVNLKPKADGLKVRVINVKASTANVLIYPNGTDNLYGVNDFETVYPDEARELDCNSVEGYY